MAYFACALDYLTLGMNVFDATVHALTTGPRRFSNYDASLWDIRGNAETRPTAILHGARGVTVRCAMSMLKATALALPP